MHEDSLTAVLADFARTVLTDYPVQQGLDDLAARIGGLLPVSGAAITRRAPGSTPLHPAAATTQALAVGRLQATLREGPSVTVLETGEPIASPDLAADDRYPRFGPAAATVGVAAMFAFPLRHDTIAVGSLDLYRDIPGPLAADVEVTARTLAEVAAAYLLIAQARRGADHHPDWSRLGSLRDAVTGLPNRVLLQERIEQASVRAQRSHRAAAVLLLDLDHFMRVNATHGHAVGDQLVVAVARRLSKLLRAADTLARVSGGEFVFLCEDLASPTDVEVLVRRIDSAFADPFVLRGVRVTGVETSAIELVVTASVGIAYAGPGEAITDELVLDADIAMHRAARRGGSSQVIDLRLAAEAYERGQLEKDLQIALTTHALDVAYQPIVRTSDQVVTGVEALLRWVHPVRGPIPASTAIDVAEQCGLIAGVGALVLERGCDDWVHWSAEHPEHRLDLSVNVAAHQLVAPGFAANLAGILCETGMNPTALVLEITEAVFREDASLTLAVLRDLRGMGVRIALDDFGTGYSSLTHLRHYPVDIVKIDQAFVSDLGRDPAASTIVAALTHLAHDLGKTVTAEGVETAAQCAEILELGCELAQGYFFARPMPASDLAGRLN